MDHSHVSLKKITTTQTKIQLSKEVEIQVPNTAENNMACLANSTLKPNLSKTDLVFKHVSFTKTTRAPYYI